MYPTRSLAWCLMLLLWGSSAWGMTGTGNDWNKYNEDVHLSYILGIVHGWGFASWKHGDAKWSELYAPLDTCLSKMKLGQLVAIFDKYLKENPEEWDHSVASLLFDRLSVVCKDKQ